MRLESTCRPGGCGRAGERGSVLILVLWIAFGLVVLSLYFAQSMTFELRSADNRVAALEAEHAIEGGFRYVQYVMSNLGTNGFKPSALDYVATQLPVGEATCWILGRSDEVVSRDLPWFELADEASKLNLNTATAAMLEALPRMTPQFAAAIVDWRDADSTPAENGAEEDVYSRLQPPRKCKNAPFESVEELRLVYGAELEILVGEDMNGNGVLDPNENDGDQSPPFDNQDGKLDPGLFEYVTVFSREANTRTDGTARINVNTGRQQLTRLFQEKFGQERGAELLRSLPQGQNVRSVLEFLVRTRMTPDEFAQVQSDLTTTNGATIQGLVNVNTAAEAVLACIPGIGVEKAASVVAYRKANAGQLGSMAWLKDVLDEGSAIQAGPYVTGGAYQITADIAAVGHHGRGYRRVRFVIDTSGGTAVVRSRRDLTHLGWALGEETRETLQLANQALR